MAGTSAADKNAGKTPIDASCGELSKTNCRGERSLTTLPLKLASRQKALALLQ
jgi:hypothetical protein